MENIVAVFLNHKGGVGKSSNSNILAQICNKVFGKTVLLNLDYDQPYREELTKGSNLNFVNVPESMKNLAINQIMESQGLDNVFIDSGGYTDTRVTDNMEYINTLVFPTMTDKGSWLMLNKMFDIYHDEIKTKKSIIIINRYENVNEYANTRKQIIKEVIEPRGLTKHIEIYGIKNSKVAKSVNDGISINEMLSKNNKHVYSNFISYNYKIIKKLKGIKDEK